MPEPLLLLPGIVMPATIRYEPLLQALGSDASGVTTELEVYREATVPLGYSIAMEVESVDRAADAAGFDRFHLYAHSGGGAVALAFAAERGDRLLSLALDEPACDFSPESLDEIRLIFLPMLERPIGEMMASFISRQLRPGVAPPPRANAPPAWMANRPLGIAAFVRALATASVSTEGLGSLRAPVYYSYGSQSHESWSFMRDRLARRIPSFTSEEYAGLHHFATSHQEEPGRVADALRALWARAARGG